MISDKPVDENRCVVEINGSGGELTQTMSFVVMCTTFFSLRSSGFTRRESATAFGHNVISRRGPHVLSLVSGHGRACDCMHKR
jgi:hypothetical protein